MGARRSSDSPGEPDLDPTAPNWPAWVEFMVTTHFDLVLGPTGPLKSLIRPRKTLLGTWEVPG